MFINSFKIHNYKSYLETDTIALEPGFNVIVGQNDAGKTALLELLSLKFKNNPHKTLQTLPSSGDIIKEKSCIHMDFHLSGDEVVALLKKREYYYKIINDVTNSKEMLSSFPKQGLSFERKCFALDNDKHDNELNKKIQNVGVPPLDIDNNNLVAVMSIKYEDKLTFGNSVTVDGTRNKSKFFDCSLYDYCKSNIYYFKAERYNTYENQISGNQTTLNPDASNLSTVLHNLQTKNPARFRRFVKLVKIVFPHIYDITVPPEGKDKDLKARVYIWCVDPEKERDDLSIPLNECGTGIGQVLSILYIIVTSETPKCIIIDEPQSFLHPGAIKKLIEILKNEPKSELKHQYIISTHYPSIISVSSPETILQVKNENSRSSINYIKGNDSKGLKLVLQDVGVSLSDVFGADNIIWVEGVTEEECFKLIHNKLGKKKVYGIEIIGLINTGDFDSKRTKTIFDIYSKLSKGKSLLPPALGFIFDREKRSEEEQNDLERQGQCQAQAPVKFTKKRMFENYLLNIQAITDVINKIDGFRDENFSEEEIKEWIIENGLNYIDNKEKIEVFAPEWFQEVHGAYLLKDLFSQLSDNRVTYDKIYHGIELTKFIIDNSPEGFVDVVEMIDGMIK